MKLTALRTRQPRPPSTLSGTVYQATLSPVHLSDGVVFGPLQSEEGTTEGVQDSYLRAKALIWPGLSYMCHIRSTAVHISAVLVLTGVPCLVLLTLEP